MPNEYRVLGIDQSDGTDALTQSVDQKLSTSSFDYKFLIAQGKIKNLSSFYVTGHNDNVGVTQTTLWPCVGNYTRHATGSALDFVSDNVNDTAAGTGCTSILVAGVDSNFDPVIETLATNGTTPVSTVGTDYIAVNTLRMVGAGSGKTNEGAILLNHTTSGDPLSCMEAGTGLAPNSLLTVPTGFSVFFVSGSYRVGKKQAAEVDFDTVTITETGLVYKEIVATVHSQGGGNYAEKYEVPLIVPEKTTVLTEAASSTTGTSVLTIHDAILVDETGAGRTTIDAFGI